MINRCLLVLFLSLFGCSSHKRVNLIELAEQSNYSHIKKTAVHSNEEASKILQARYNFLTLLFEQSRDPYYGHPKWTEQCLAANKIGNLLQKDSMLYSVSELYVDGNGSPGFCPGAPFTVRAFEVNYFCENENQVYQVILPHTGQLDLDKVRLCKK